VIFEELLAPQTSPTDASEGETRLAAIRQVIKDWSTAERLAISEDKALMGKARLHVGDVAFMALLAAVGTYATKKKIDGGTEKSHHMTGAEADVFIQTNIASHSHLAPFIATAVAGRGRR
jgi:hypothetical protein